MDDSPLRSLPSGRRRAVVIDGRCWRVGRRTIRTPEAVLVVIAALLRTRGVPEESYPLT